MRDAARLEIHAKAPKSVANRTQPSTLRKVPAYSCRSAFRCNLEWRIPIRFRNEAALVLQGFWTIQVVCKVDEIYRQCCCRRARLGICLRPNSDNHAATFTTRKLGTNYHFPYAVAELRMATRIESI